MAALEWARRLHLYEERSQIEERPNLAPDFNQSKRLTDIVKLQISQTSPAQEGVDTPYLGGLITVVGFSRLPDPAAQELGKLLLDIRVGEWIELQIPILLSLSRLGRAPSSELNERLLKVLSEEDPALKKMGIFAAGVLAQSPEARSFFLPRLLELRHESTADLRWNAAFALARWGHFAEAEPVLKELLELASHVQRDATIADAPQEVMSEWTFASLDQAFRLVARGGSEDLRQKLAVIARGHPHLKLRQSAISALKSAQ
jgi:hypothetical protein